MQNNNNKILAGVVAIFLAGYALSFSVTFGHYSALAITELIFN